MRWILISLAASLTLLPQARGEEKILGASKAIEQVQAQLKKPVPAAAPKIGSVSEFTKQVEKLQTSLKTLKPAEHAARWLELADAAAALINVEERYSSREMVPQLVSVLPPPETWPKLIETLRAKPIPEHRQQNRGIVVLHGFAAVLANDKAALEKLANDTTDPRLRFNLNQRGGEPVESRVDVDDWNVLSDKDADLDPAVRVAKIEKFLSQKRTDTLRLVVPDLISILGQDKAAALIDTILKTPEITQLQTESSATRKLIKERALAVAESMPRPLWELIEDDKDLPLYEAFSKLSKPAAQLTPAAPFDPLAELPVIGVGTIPRAAEDVLLAKLLDEGKNDEVKKILTRRNEEGARESNPYGNHRSRYSAPREPFNEERGAKLLKLYTETFTEKPANLPWEEFFELAAKQKDLEPTKKRVDAVLADSKLSASTKLNVATQYFHFLLGREQTDDAVRVLRTHLLNAPYVRTQGYPRQETPIEQALKLYLLGDLLDNEEWEKEGLAQAEKRFAEQLAKHDLADLNREFPTLFTALLNQKRFADAEKLAIDLLAVAVRSENARSPGQREHGRQTREALSALCVVYDEMNRRDEIIKLLDTAPWWGLDNLGDLVDESFANRNLGVIIARAMADAKQTDHALKILEVVIEKNSGLDPAYELLIGIDPAGSMKKLERWARLDPYQERPLIWQAKLLLVNGDVPRAGQVIREAVTIDPSDGEQGKNTRMHVYKVFAEVLRKEGDEDTAKIFDGAIAAIRKSERADDYRIAGLHSIARKMYKDSLGHFNDAYCIQSRLAIQLYENGDLEQAAIHFERAFQLMPNSFGMIESHCFGCEGAFASDMAQELAEKIFLRLLQEDPKKPQVHYLLGYLRSTQGRKSEAIKHYQEAVRLAPRYLNAWSKLADIVERRPEHAALYDETQLALLRIDPLQKHSRVDTDKIHDWKKLWQALEVAYQERVSPASFSYELTAAKAEQQRLQEQQRNSGPRTRGINDPFDSPRDHSEQAPPAPYPGQVLSHNGQIRELQQLLNN